MKPILLSCGLALSLTLLAGCGDRTAKVSGKVLYKDKPVRGGTVMFQPIQPGRGTATAALDEEGRYELTVTVGEVLILVDNRELAPRDKAAPPGIPSDLKLPKGFKADPKAAEAAPKSGGPVSAGKYDEIPSKYYQFETSGLKHEITGDTQAFNIVLK